MVIGTLTRVGDWVHGNSVSSLKLHCKSKIVSKSSLLKEISTALKTVFSDIERKSCNNSQQKPLSVQKESSDSAVGRTGCSRARRRGPHMLRHF